MKTQAELALIQQNDGSELMPEVVNGKVDARSVHEALEVNEKFTDWIKRRCTEFGFVEGEDFEICRSNFGSKTSGSGGHNRTEYLTTLDMAKELAMVERNEAGRKMRRYFIECEKRWVSVAQAAPAVLPATALSKIQQINAVLIEEVTGHASRIEKLESTTRPGPDWQSPTAWLGSRVLPIQAWGGRLSRLSAACTQKSAVMGLPIGKEIFQLPNGSKNERRSFSPAVLEAVCPYYMAKWEKRDSLKQGGTEA